MQAFAPAWDPNQSIYIFFFYLSLYLDQSPSPYNRKTAPQHDAATIVLTQRAMVSSLHLMACFSLWHTPSPVSPYTVSTVCLRLLSWWKCPMLRFFYRQQDFYVFYCIYFTVYHQKHTWAYCRGSILTACCCNHYASWGGSCVTMCCVWLYYDS